MSDGSTSYIGFGKTMASHRSVIQSQNEYANPETGAHANTAEAVISQMARALVGVYHDLGRKHLQRYLDEIIWRWNDRDPAGEIYMQWTTKSGNLRGKSHDDLETGPGGHADAVPASRGRRKADAPINGIRASLA